MPKSNRSSSPGLTPLCWTGESESADVYEHATGARLGSYGREGPVPLVPGRYILQVSGSTSAPVAVESGETIEFQLGAIYVDGSFEVWDAAGDRLGYYGNTLLLVPGTYTLELDDGTVVEDVVVVAGQVTEVP